MKKEIFNGGKITIRSLVKGDFKKARKFQRYINSLIKEGAKIKLNQKVSLKKERQWLKEHCENIKKKRAVSLLAECKEEVVGMTGIGLGKGNNSHIGYFGISVRNGYRKIGLGKYLLKEILKSAKKEFKPKIKFIRLSVYPTNKPALKLYQKFGFKKVARIPKQINYKGRLFDEIIMLKKI